MLVPARGGAEDDVDQRIDMAGDLLESCFSRIRWQRQCVYAYGTEE